MLHHNSQLLLNSELQLPLYLLRLHHFVFVTIIDHSSCLKMTYITSLKFNAPIQRRGAFTESVAMVC
ncbi:hypothetical protein QWZ13_11800 [Reinekea marina]|uniref:hypothetical protein n=1 Tax=Reinekea marina TaxID=1310421 RepID=UPI0025B49164|nr:hypothetical protein [Reinekea marina]MDN3649600.1 hypothetical protein [Reinekea marina]